jgi:ankyrin repeat protein
MLINYFKNIFYVVVLIGFSCSHAGSYDDFFQAIKRDDVRTIQNLLSRGFDPNTLAPDLQPGLIYAIRSDSAKVALVMAQNTASKVEVRNANDESALMFAALKGMAEVCELLISRDADVNKPGWTALHYAATGGHVPVIRLLLEHNAYIDAASPNGTTPLMMAALYGFDSSVYELIESGADPMLKNAAGLNAVDFALKGRSPDSLTLILNAVGRR